VQHHIDSFNKFIDYGLQKIIDEQRTIETDIEDTYLKLGKIRVEHPVVKEADGAIEKLYPNEARLRKPLIFRSSLPRNERGKRRS